MTFGLVSADCFTKELETPWFYKARVFIYTHVSHNKLRVVFHMSFDVYKGFHSNYFIADVVNINHAAQDKFQQHQKQQHPKFLPKVFIVK